nr:hypothetical protein [Tanacetum cinerariifolium]
MNCRSKGPAIGSNLQPVFVIFLASGEKGHYQSQCSKTNINANERTYLMRDKNAHQDPNVVTDHMDLSFRGGCSVEHAQPEDTQELLRKLIEDLQIISEELTEYINSLSWNRPAFYNDDDEYSIQYKEYLDNSTNAIAPVLPIEEPDNSLKEFNAEIADTIVESFSSSPIPIEDSDFHMEETDLFLNTNDLMSSGIESDDYDSKGDIYFLDELLSNDSLPFPENESSNFDPHNDPSFPRPPSRPSDVEIFFYFKPVTGVLTAKMEED